MSMNDGGGMMELALLFGFVVAIILFIVMYYGLFKLSRWLYRKNKILVLAPWIPAFPSLFWFLFNLSLPDNYPQVSVLFFRLLLLTPFFDTWLLLAQFPIPLMLYFHISYGSLIFRYLQLRHKDFK